MKKQSCCESAGLSLHQQSTEMKSLQLYIQENFEKIERYVSNIHHDVQTINCPIIDLSEHDPIC